MLNNSLMAICTTYIGGLHLNPGLARPGSPWLISGSASFIYSVRVLADVTHPWDLSISIRTFTLYGYDLVDLAIYRHKDKEVSIEEEAKKVVQWI